jgi:hypothetical protein
MLVGEVERFVLVYVHILQPSHRVEPVGGDVDTFVQHFGIFCSSRFGVIVAYPEDIGAHSGVLAVNPGVKEVHSITVHMYSRLSP